MTAVAYIGCGSNLGDSRAQLLAAHQALALLPDTDVLAVSGFYRSRPLGDAAIHDFINTVVSLCTTLPPLTLLHHLQDIETAQGRVRTLRWGPRTLDLDLIMYGSVQCHTPELTLPHPGLYQRDFVLKPLAEIAPNVILPNGRTVEAALMEVEALVYSDE